MTDDTTRFRRSSREPGGVVRLPSTGVAVRPADDDVDAANAQPAVALGARSLARAAA